MLTIRRAILLLILFTIFVANPAAANPKLGVNLLKNSDFTNELTSWKVYEHGNRFDAKVPPVEAKWLPHGGPDKSGSLYIHPKYPPEDKFSYFVQVSQCVPIGDAVEFEVGASLKHEGIPKNQYANRINIHWYKDLDCASEGQHGPLVPPQLVSGWQKISEKNIKPMLGARAAVIEILKNVRGSIDRKDPSKISKTHWDNIYFKATRLSNKEKTEKIFNAKHTLPLNQNHIINGTFNKDVSSWSRGLWVLDWIGSEGDTKPGAMKIKATSKNGSTGSSVFWQCANFGANQRFNAGASFKKDPDSTQEGVRMFRITWYEREGCQGRSKMGKSTNSDNSKTGWQKIVLDHMHAPENTVSAMIEAGQAIKGSGVYTVFWDDVYFKAVP